MATVPERIASIETTQKAMLDVLNTINTSINGNSHPGIKQNYIELKLKVDAACDKLGAIEAEKEKTDTEKRKHNWDIRLLVVAQILSFLVTMGTLFLKK